MVFLGKVAVALGAMSAVLWWTMGEDAVWLTGAVWWRIGRLSMLVALGVATYFGSLWLLGFRLRDFSKKGS
jgi:putative peptidoglycan lipid II flippase